MTVRGGWFLNNVDKILSGIGRLFHSRITLVPSYKGFIAGIEIKVRPCGYRRIWPLRWWWPYWRGSNLELCLTFTSKRNSNISYKIIEPSGLEWGHGKISLEVGKGKSAIVSYPSSKILGIGEHEYTLSVSVNNKEQNEQSAIVASFTVFDQDRFVVGILIPAILGGLITFILMKIFGCPT